MENIIVLNGSSVVNHDILRPLKYFAVSFDPDFFFLSYYSRSCLKPCACYQANDGQLDS